MPRAPVDIGPLSFPAVWDVRDALPQLPAAQLAALERYWGQIDKLLVELPEDGSEPLPARDTGQVLAEHRGDITVRLEKVRCGKPRCRCARGQLHGPYWYGYESRRGRRRSFYIGKTLSKLSAEQRARCNIPVEAAGE